MAGSVNDSVHADSILQLERSRRRADDLLVGTRLSVAGRLRAWQLFEDSVRRVLGLIKRLKYARNMASLKGNFDLPHILSAKQSIEVSFFFTLIFIGKPQFRLVKSDTPPLKFYTTTAKCAKQKIDRSRRGSPNKILLCDNGETDKVAGRTGLLFLFTLPRPPAELPPFFVFRLLVVEQRHLHFPFQFDLCRLLVTVG